MQVNMKVNGSKHMSAYQREPPVPHGGDLSGTPDFGSSSGPASSLHLDPSQGITRSNLSGGSTVSNEHGKRHRAVKPLSSKLAKSLPPLSRIPLPIKTSSVVHSIRAAEPAVVTTPLGKHTLEMQFFNKNRKYVQMKNDILKKQKPMLDIYQNLLDMKKKLEKHNKLVQLEDIRLVLYYDYTKEGKMKDRLIKELQEKVDMQELQISESEKKVRELEENLLEVNKNHVMRLEMIETMKKNLENTEAHVKQLDEINAQLMIMAQKWLNGSGSEL